MIFPNQKRGKKMNDIIKELSLIGIVPVIKIDDAKDAAPLAKALIDGGLPCAEVTFRTAAAKEAISIIAKEYPEMIVGAGTVLTKAQVDDAIEAGAKFIVSPGFNPEIVKYCQEKGCPIVPGINNPEIELPAYNPPVPNRAWTAMRKEMNEKAGNTAK